MIGRNEMTESERDSRIEFMRGHLIQATQSRKRLFDRGEWSREEMLNANALITLFLVELQELKDTIDA